MRTNIDIDERLLTEAMRYTGLGTKKAAVEEALRRVLADRDARQAIKDLRGLGWKGDLDTMRRAEFEPPHE